MTILETIKVMVVTAETAVPHVAEAAAVAAVAAEMEAVVQVDLSVADQAVLSAIRRGSQLASSRNG